MIKRKEEEIAKWGNVFFLYAAENCIQRENALEKTHMQRNNCIGRVAQVFTFAITG